MKAHNRNINTLILILIASVYNLCIQNGLEKIVCDTYFKGDFIKRPNCLNYTHGIDISCVGMPSGHTETITIASSLLYLYKLIPLWICLLVILVVAMQRVIYNRHTLFQVIAGAFTGLMYAFIYKKMNLSIYSFMVVFGIGLLLALLCIYKIDTQVYGPIPKWVDPVMMQSIKKKQNSPFYMKVISIYVNTVWQIKTHINWEQLEHFLDIIIDKIRNSGERFDAIVGIKTGGAIIADYMSIKLGLPNYKIKITNRAFNCDKNPKDALEDIRLKLFYKKYDYIICEEIDDNLTGKNIILVDESVISGVTINEAYKYLKEQKKVNYIYPTSISLDKRTYKYDLDIPHATSQCVVWPWGYDN